MTSGLLLLTPRAGLRGNLVNSQVDLKGFSSHRTVRPCLLLSRLYQLPLTLSTLISLSTSELEDLLDENKEQRALGKNQLSHG